MPSKLHLWFEAASSNGFDLSVWRVGVVRFDYVLAGALRQAAQHGSGSKADKHGSEDVEHLCRGTSVNLTIVHIDDTGLWLWQQAMDAGA